jgi:hypothetical protein
MIYNNHRNGSISSDSAKSKPTGVDDTKRSGKISETKPDEKPRSYGCNNCEKIGVVNGKLRIVDC